jgi:1,4-dihydroxy-2-naphthoate octaprenyltransferase
MVKNIIRALRLPFLSASVLPFIFGSLVVRYYFNFAGFFYGLIAVIATHLSANLINDYADAKSGADAYDKNFYKFFGGSKLIQKGVFSEKFYLKAAILFVLVSISSVILLYFNLKRFIVLSSYLAIIILSWQYSARPLKLSYRRLGEFVIFLTFGPALVMGGYFIQTKIFPNLKGALLSLPFGFLTTAILFINEIPDFKDDIKAKKYTWVSVTGPKRAFMLYYAFVLLAFISILICVLRRHLTPFSCFSFIPVLFAIRAANILQKFTDDKVRLMDSSRLTIMIHTLVSLILIADIVICKR